MRKNIADCRTAYSVRCGKSLASGCCEDAPTAAKDHHPCIQLTCTCQPGCRYNLDLAASVSFSSVSPFSSAQANHLKQAKSSLLIFAETRSDLCVMFPSVLILYHSSDRFRRQKRKTFSCSTFFPKMCEITCPVCWTCVSTRIMTTAIKSAKWHMFAFPAR